MTRLSDERLADIRAGMDALYMEASGLRDLLAEIDFHRKKDAELHRLAFRWNLISEPSVQYKLAGDIASAVLDKCRPT